MPGRTVRIVGNDDEWEVVADTGTSMILVNPAARLRREIDEIDTRIRDLREELRRRQTPRT